MMSKVAESVESYLLQLCQQAKDLGASQAVAIPAVDIVLDERCSLKCLVPLCSHYGVDLMCPPNLLPVSQFKEILKCYDSAILIKVDVSQGDPSMSTEEEEPSEIPAAEYMNAVREAKKKLHEIVCQVESFCIRNGYYFAAGLVGGSCPLCEECVGVKSGLPCRYPFKARPAMEAMGIDVMATTKKVGLDLSFGQNEGRSWVGLVLVS